MILRFVNGGQSGNGQGQTVLDEFPLKPRVCNEQTVCIRPYREADRQSIRHLCCETGFLGNPVEPLFQDRELFADLFTRTYLDYAPEWALVAEVEGAVVGYLLGAVSRHFDLLLMRSGLVTTAKMVFRLASGRYAKHPPSRRFVRWLLTAGYREQPRHPANAAHLHWDINKGFRGRYICQRLWSAYEQRLREIGMAQCYGSFFSYNGRRPESVYARYGFSVFDRRRTTLFQPQLAETVEVVCVRKHIG